MSKFGEPLNWSAEAVCEYEARVFSVESKETVCSITCANDNFYIVERMCDCVNALAGIEDPVEWIRDAIEFMSWAMSEINETNEMAKEMKSALKKLLEQANVEASDADKG